MRVQRTARQHLVSILGYLACRHETVQETCAGSWAMRWDPEPRRFSLSDHGAGGTRAILLDEPLH